MGRITTECMMSVCFLTRSERPGPNKIPSRECFTRCVVPLICFRGSDLARERACLRSDCSGRSESLGVRDGPEIHQVSPRFMPFVRTPRPAMAMAIHVALTLGNSKSAMDGLDIYERSPYDNRIKATSIRL